MLRFLYLICLLSSPILWAAGIPIETNFQTSYSTNGKTSTGENKVILVLVSQPNCSYCIQITEEILQPMIISGQYEESTVFSEVEINTGRTLKDHTGQIVDATDFARRYNAWATPTLLFLNGKGEEVSDKMVGINTLDLYGYYVDKSLRIGYKKINP